MGSISAEVLSTWLVATYRNESATAPAALAMLLDEAVNTAQFRTAVGLQRENATSAAIRPLRRVNQAARTT